MENRIFGIETEFGCFVRDESVGRPERVVEKVKDCVFYRLRRGLIDLHSRDFAFEPARGGGFLVNGGRLYIDAVGDHEEYATPECSRLADLVAHEKAGQRILNEALQALGWQDRVSFYNNAVDHFGGHTFGCHENYLVSIEDRYFLDSLYNLLPFLVTRQIFAGTGRVGGHRLNYNDFSNNIMDLGEHEMDYVWVSRFYAVEIDPTVDYQLSQRADHIVKTISSRVRFNRAIINPKWDSYYSYNSMHRLHILFGEGNMSEYATALKIGTTSLVLDLLERNLIRPDVRLADPLEALRSVSRDPTWKWVVRRHDGSTIRAIDLQRIYLQAAQEHLAGRDEDTDWVLREWEYVLDALELDPMSLDDRLDWVAKRKLLEAFRQQEGLSWHDDMMFSLDMEYHNTDPSRGLYYGLVEAGLMKRIVTDEEIGNATTTAPDNTRAYGRSRAIQHLLASRNRAYIVDWDMVYVDKGRQLELRNPFRTYEKEAERFIRSL
jgi:proteasome accessory factor A